MAQVNSIALAAACLVGSCAMYEPQPLDPERVLSSVLADLDASDDPVTMREAVRLMLAHNRHIVASRGSWEEARAVASVAAPLANPALGIGPVFLSGGSGTWGLEAAIGWVIPISGRRQIIDDRNTALADAARVNVVAAARREYLGLRVDLIAAASNADRLGVERAISSVLERIVEVQRSLGANATFTALELQLLELEMLEQRSVATGAEADTIRVRGSLAVRCGVAPERIAKLAGGVRPKLPKDLPPQSRLRQLLSEHPDLAMLRARYEVSEHMLRLEVRRQYPDLQMGGELEREGGGNRFVLPLGIVVPLFDRNQGPIARACASRKALREEYRAVVREKLGELAGAYAVLEVRHAQYAKLDAQFDRRIQGVRDLIAATVRNGRMDATSWALALRRLHTAQRSRIAARSDIYTAWLQLEKSCGAPLLKFPGEPKAPKSAEVPK
jgi:outer membrane protein TolC